MKSEPGHGESILDLVFHAEAFAFNENSLGMVEEPVQERGGERTVIVEDLSPVLVGPI